jgi:mannose/fructose/N-acetylgalactosamine-specific phosphotransferase system component IIB
VGTFGLVRIDDRLIHGQVVALWVKHLQAKRIVIVDDQVAKDVFLQTVLRGAAPPGISVEVATLEAAPKALDRPEGERSKTMSNLSPGGDGYSAERERVRAGALWTSGADRVVQYLKWKMEQEERGPV